MGYRCVESEQNYLQYETNQIFAAIKWDPRSGELDFYVGLRKESPYSYSLTDILAMENAGVPEQRHPFQVADKNKLEPFIKKLADDASKYARPALAGNLMFFRRMKVFTNEKAQAYMQEMKFTQIRSEVKEAWKERNYEKIIDLYTPIEERLSRSEKGKLDYAKKQIRV